MEMQKNCNKSVIKTKAGLPAASTTVQCVVAETSPGTCEDWLECSRPNCRLARLQDHFSMLIRKDARFKFGDLAILVGIAGSYRIVEPHVRSGHGLLLVFEDDGN
jgi:hypothetical protein